MTRNSFKNAAKSVQVKSVASKFIIRNIDEDVAVKRIETFFKRYGLAVSYDVDRYFKGHEESKQRKMLVILMKVILLIIGLRFAITGLSGNLRIRAMMCDSNYRLGHPRFISSMMSICAFVILFIGLTLQYQESQKDFCLFKFLYAIKHKHLVNKLNPLQYRRLILYSNLLTKYLLSPAFWSMVVVTNVFMCTATLLAYLEPESGFTLIGIISWSLLTFFWTIQFYGYVSIGFVLWFMSTFALKHQFRRIGDEFKEGLRKKNMAVVLKTIKDHQNAEIMTQDMNKFFKLMIFIVYYFGTPGLEVLVFLTHDSDTKFYTRFGAAFIFVLVFGVVFAINYMSTWVSKAANKCSPAIHGFMSRRVINNNQMKLVTFLEAMIDREIGFYCYDMFPMNNYEFYQYLYITGINYFLILDLKSRLNT